MLLDSHFVLWITSDRAQLRRAEQLFLERDDVFVVVSSVALWELRLKWDSLDRFGKPKLDANPRDILAVVQAAGWEQVDLDATTAVTALDIVPPHKDPFDILLLVQARQLGIPLLTRDEKLAGHPQVYALPV